MKTSRLIFSATAALTLIAGGGLYGKTQSQDRQLLSPVRNVTGEELLRSGRVVDPPMTGLPTSSVDRVAPMRTMSYPGFLYEDFEEMEPLHLSNGWVATATPGLPDDIWNVATLQSENKTIEGVSGKQYAYILGNRDINNPVPHDAWLFSPKVKLNAGEEYAFSFYAFMPSSNEADEELEVYVATGTDSNDAVEQLDRIVSDPSVEPSWKGFIYKFTPEADEEYCIAFHSVSKAKSNATLIDDVGINTWKISGYYSESGVSFGQTDLKAGTYSTRFSIRNAGTAPLEIDYVSSSPEIKIIDVPLKVPAGAQREITVEFTPVKCGPYSGHFVLSTNDPRYPTVDIVAISEVIDVPVTDFMVEDFESGGPKGWRLPIGVTNTDYIKGHNGPRALYTRGFYSLDMEEEIGFISHYVNMGDKPFLEMWLKFIECDLLGVQMGPLASDVPILHVFISDNCGKTWEEVWTMEPGGEHEHTGDADFYPVRIDLPQYAGKRCQVKTVLRNAKSLPKDFIFVMDDVAIGTRPDVDLRAWGLNGLNSIAANTVQEVSVTIENIGAKPSGSYEVKLIDRNGLVVATSEGLNIDAGHREDVKLQWTPVNEGIAELYAVVSTDDDNNKDNDRSNTLSVSVLAGETSIIIDNSPTSATTDVPIDFGVAETAVQTLYYANELGIDAGLITGVSFTSAFDVDHLTENFEVFVAETDIQDFSNKDWVPDTDFKKVFEGQFFLPAGSREFTIPFATPYDYKGGNLVIMTRKLSDSYIVTKSFVAHKSETPRTISSTSTLPHQLVEGGYANPLPMNMYGHIIINMQKADAGKVSGKVHDSVNMIDGVEVRVEGTQRYTFTDKDGTFDFPELKTGNRKFSATKYGYYPSIGNEAYVTKNEETVIDIVMTPYPRKKLEGTVVDTDGNPISGAKVVLQGYDDYSTVTNEKGEYIVEDIYADTGVAYDLRFESLYYKTVYKRGLEINDDMRYDVTLMGEALRPFKVAATEEDGGAVISWCEPLPEFSHDNGKPVQYLGWSNGHNRTAIITTYRQKLCIKEIRFYLTDIGGWHDKVNLLIFGLNSEGRPDTSRVVWRANNVPYSHNEWTSFYLDEPLTMDGFALGINCDGFLGLGATASDSEHPFGNNMHFFCSDDYASDLDVTDFDPYMDVHPMLRVSGEYLGDPMTGSYRHTASAIKITRPDVEYDIYRYDADKSLQSKVKVSATGYTEYRDENFANLDFGKYNYAVVARYPDGQSEEVFAAIEKHSPGSVNSIDSEKIVMNYDSRSKSLTIDKVELIDHISIYCVDGSLAKRIDFVNEYNDLSSLQPGTYIVTVGCLDRSVITKKYIII